MSTVEVLTRTTAAGPVRVTSPAPREVWWRLAGEDPAALVTQTPTWLDSLCATAPFEDASRLYVFGGGRRVVVPLVRRRGLPRYLTAEESWPSGWGIGGPLSAPGPPDAEEAAVVLGDLARRPALRVGVRCGPDADPVWASAAPPGFAVEALTTYVLELDGGFGTVWERRFHGRIRRDVRRGERSAVEVEVGRGGRLVPEFYGLYETSMLRWAAHQHEPRALARLRRSREFPRRYLEEVAGRFGDGCAVYLARVGGEPAAGVVVVSHGDRAKYWRGAMDRDLAHSVRANFLLQRLAIEDACAEGRTAYVMGDSRPGSSLAHFKEGFGAEGRPSLRYRRERLPLTRADRLARTAAKRLLRFRDA
ncbi:GNAT family N-acetyltransferase [Streptomyces sp. G2]|uniref:GNAT family N-acetyltransferase n=1 Tax=Streptomyces sp. G2 TaxID=1684471 RepID=UPI00202E6D40|nr:GNAT family N-acetyltransferase [Streptomyces sp. G2]MCM1945154.1 GNAT family N-acetyltransferase [Streptomyces sp. G2]